MDRQLFKNIVYTVAAQSVTIVASVCMSGVIPKFTSVADFGYWQLFILYSSFIGLLHFGLVDGMYLRFGGQNLSDLSPNSLHSLFAGYALFQIGLCLVCGAAVLALVSGPERIVMLLVALYIPIKNIYNFFSFTLLATNNIVHTSRCEMLRKTSLIVLIMLMALWGNLPFWAIIAMYMVSETIPLFLVVKPFATFRGASLLPAKSVLHDAWSFIRTGISLTISNIVGSLILGVGRLFIKGKWDIETFGKVSLALSLAFFLTMVITQASLALFPFIRNASDERRKSIYDRLERLLSILFYFIFIFYFPLAYIVDLWLPDYTESVGYLAIFVVFCLYEGKMQLLYTTYFKCLNMQRRLMTINIATFSLSVATAAVATLWLESLHAVLYAMVFSLVFRNIVSHFAISNALSLSHHRTLIIDIAMSCTFIAMQSLLPWWGALLGATVLVAAVTLWNKAFIRETIKTLRVH